MSGPGHCMKAIGRTLLRLLLGSTQSGGGAPGKQLT